VRFQITTPFSGRGSAMRKSSKKNRWMIVSLLLAATAAFVPAAFSRGSGDEN